MAVKLNTRSRVRPDDGVSVRWVLNSSARTGGVAQLTTCPVGAGGVFR